MVHFLGINQSVVQSNLIYNLMNILYLHVIDSYNKNEHDEVQEDNSELLLHGQLCALLISH